MKVRQGRLGNGLAVLAGAPGARTRFVALGVWLLALRTGCRRRADGLRSIG
jgi:hypothetical protein